MRIPEHIPVAQQALPAKRLKRGNAAWVHVPKRITFVLFCVFHKILEDAQINIQRMY